MLGRRLWGSDSALGLPTGPTPRVPRAPRATRVMLVARLVTGQSDQLCRVMNISEGGLMMHSAATLRSGDRVRLELRNGRILDGAVVWADRPAAGVQFDGPVDLEQVLAPNMASAEQVARAPRMAADCMVLVRCDGRTLPASLLDLSQSGTRIRLAEPVCEGDQLTLAIPGLPTVRGAVRWVRGDEAGIAFFDVLRFDDVARWLQDPDSRYGGGRLSHQA
ncbi:PilZ domain-containing protein [Sphingomonas sp. LY54]|uniref:PilZ domain-containing protein n=1 Tax=Sphingomonas sp. LY54 TaxID=3095343 RepID=UPI002D76C926|nr:PilZ domain-containing protein [Sphingomonas sp. LY54]WRP27271.1 PilZ domain-containing protein [Sphingomonas sp. LY54]